MARTINSLRLSRFFAVIRVGFLVAGASCVLVLPIEHAAAQTGDRPASAVANESAAGSRSEQSAESSSMVHLDAIQFDSGQTEPLLEITRQQLFGRRLTYRPVFKLTADGKLTNRGGSSTEKTIQLTPKETQLVLRQAVVVAKFFSLDASKFQKQFTKAAVGTKSFRVKDQVVTKIELKVKAGQKTLAIRGYSLARLKLTELTEFQNLAAVESICEFLIAERVVGDRSSEVLAAINAEIKNRNLTLPEVKAEDLRAAFERPGGRFQARYSTLTKPNVNDGETKMAKDDFQPQPVRITYFVKSQGAEPTIRFFGNTGE